MVNFVNCNLINSSASLKTQICLYYRGCFINIFAVCFSFSCFWWIGLLLIYRRLIMAAKDSWLASWNHALTCRIDKFHLNENALEMKLSLRNLECNKIFLLFVMFSFFYFVNGYFNNSSSLIKLHSKFKFL